MEPRNANLLAVCAVFDSAVGAYLQPFYVRSRAEAIRSFTQAANQAGHQFNSFPGDYTLFVIADWNEETGSFESLEAYERLGNALEYMSQSPPSGQLDLVSDA